MGAVASEVVESVDQNVALAKPIRTPESIQTSRKTGVDKWMERGVVERWSRTEAPMKGVPLFRRRWVDNPLKDQPPCIIGERAKHRDLAVCVAASRHSSSRLAE